MAAFVATLAKTTVTSRIVRRAGYVLAVLLLLPIWIAAVSVGYLRTSASSEAKVLGL